jgi:GT2 family glycosyltransferase
MSITEQFEPGLVSVVIPTFNRSYILRTAIDSVLNQTYKNIEILVVDDGSTDATAETVAGYGPKVRYFHQKNGGVSSARNLGLMQAKGEFIALLDSDDAWLPWKVEAQLAVFRALPGVGMVWTDMTAVDPNGAQIEPRHLRHFYSCYGQIDFDKYCPVATTLGDVWPQAPAAVAGDLVRSGDIFAAMFYGSLVHTSTAMLTRRRLVDTGLFDLTLRQTGEDYEFHMRTTMHGPVALLDTPTILYRVGATDQLTRPDLQVTIARNNLTTVIRYLNHERAGAALPAADVRERLARSMGWLGEASMDSGNRPEARHYLWKSLRQKPTPRVLMLFVMSWLPPALVANARRLKAVLTGRGAIKSV